MKFLEMLSVQEADLSWVQSLLDRLIRSTVIVTGIFAGILLLLALREADIWMISGLVLFVAMLALGVVNQQGWTSMTVNLYLSALVLYALLADLLGSPLAGFNLMVYLVPVAIAALFISARASLVWAGIVTLVMLMRALIAPEIVGGFGTFLLSAICLNLAALVMWFGGRLFEQIKHDLRRQIQQGQAGIEIGHTVTSAVEPSSIVRQAVQLIHDAFSYYNVGLFLLDPEEDVAVLQDAAGEAADALKVMGFHVSLSGVTAVATAINQKRQWTVLGWEESVDAQGRPVQFTYERLSLPGRVSLATRAELVIPLQVGDRILGALDVHSTQIAPFAEEDVHTLQGLSGHIANALESARLLEDVQRRHGELTALHEQTTRRARHLETTAELARAISSLLDSRELLDKAVGLVSQGLDLYHAGIFLVDDVGEWAVLAATNSEGGRRMMAGGHKLRVGEQGIVGWVTQAGEPRIALDVGEDAVYFDSPDLPHTRSEIALPLRVGSWVIGALDVQSKREAAFGEEDVAVLQILADQIAIAIQNARLFQETQRALNEVQALQRHYVAHEWERLTTQRDDLSAEYCGLGVSSLEDAWTSEMEMALTQEQPVALPDVAAVTLGGDGRDAAEEGESSLPARSALAIPIRLRGEVIGVLDLQEMDKNRHWTEAEVTIATTVADQLALALENARLFEETQRRAAQLATASEVARGATAILDVDQLLEETVRLISGRFGFYHAGVFLLDERGEFAVLQAASSEGGQRMIERGHQLKVGEAGIVGHVATSGESRVALDVGADAAFFASPDLPETRSEMALPLRVRDQVIGVLDVQSTQPAAFSEEDVAVLQTMADQLATAIANARLFRQVRDDAVRRALINEVIQAATASLEFGEVMEQTGRVISSQLQMPCAFFEWDAGTETLKAVTAHSPTGANVMPSEPILVTAEMDAMMFQAARERQLQVQYDVPGHALGAVHEMAHRLSLLDAAYVPLVSRDRILGLLMLGRQRGHPPFDEGELSFLEVAAANLSVALENALLFQDAVHTAERLAEVDRLKGQFLANMSHELRTPLNSIIGFSRVILKGIDGPLTDMQRTDLQAVYDSGQHLLDLINDVLDLAKIEAGKMELSFEMVDLGQIIESVLKTAIALVKDKPAVELQRSIPEYAPQIRADARRVRQVLLNLVSNAAKFTEEGFVRVEVFVEPEELVVAVADSGIGIAEDKRDKIFEAFTQVDASTTRRFGGTGLGLPVSKEFVEMHGGRMWFESEENAGSTFYFSLPVAGPPQLFEEPEEEMEQGQLKPAPGQRIVLCVEDDEGVIMLYRRYLSRQGYHVVGHTDSTSVLERARQLQPFAITLDVMMPDKDGWQVIQELKADPETNHIPVIMCTIVGDKERGLSLGAADYLVKPILERELIAALDRLDREEGRHLVLVVDDNPDDRALLCRMIESQPGYEVVEAAGGQEAITLVHQVSPQLIVLDLMMPDVDGFAVLEAVKADEATRSIPIVVVTAKDLTQEERNYLISGVEALLQKGLFRRQELLADVAAALERLSRAEEREREVE